jgi:beta-lactamase superfamily II metal-dependent hydrolase
VKIKRGETFSLCGAVFTALSPDDSLIGLNDENEASIVLKMQYGKKSVLFMGDAQLKAEEKLITNYKDELLCDAIKIGHHGSNQSSSRTFLSKTNAKYAIISTGDEEPAAEVTINAISARKLQLFNTDTVGDVVLKTNGTDLTVQKKGG